jgi:hypothetical protein
MQRACLTWGDQPPAWVMLLAGHVDKTGSQRKVASAIGYSAGTISQVISNTYKGDLSAVEKHVIGALEGTNVACPVLGEVRIDRCMQHQSRKAANITSNPMWVRLHRACPKCPNHHSRTEAK